MRNSSDYPSDHIDDDAYENHEIEDSSEEDLDYRDFSDVDLEIAEPAPTTIPNVCAKKAQAPSCKGIRDEFELAHMLDAGICTPEESIAISALRIANSLEEIEKSLSTIASSFRHSYDDGK